RGVADEGDRGGGGCGAVRVGELQRQHREDDADEGLQHELLPGAQAEAALLADLDEVVGEADGAEPDHEEEDEQAAHRRRGPRPEVGEEVGQHGGEDDHRPAHRGGAPLGVVARRPVVADELPVALLDEVADEHRGAEQGDHERDDGRHDDGLHEALPLSTMRSPSHRSPESLLDLNNTTSPGASSSTSSASAAAASGTVRTRPAPPARAPGATGAATSPTTRTSSMPSSPAS